MTTLHPLPEQATIADVRRELEALICAAGIEAAERQAREARDRHMRRQLEAAVDHGAALLAALDLPQLDALDAAIATLDALDGDPDIEDGLEEDADSLEIYGEGDFNEDDEDCGDLEPSLGAPERSPATYSMGSPVYKGRIGKPRRARDKADTQERWAEGSNDDREDPNEGLEAEAGYDLPEGDDERDGADNSSGFDDDERTLGWNETVSQLSLGIGTEDGDLSALESFGRGFVRSGPDDSEDDDPAEDDGDAEPGDGAWEGALDQTRWCAMVALPAVYAMRCGGDCCEPAIPDGSRCIMDSEAAFGPGDFVAVHHDDPEAEGGVATKVKQLAHDLPWSTFPVVADVELLPVISCRTLNPPRPIWYDPAKVHAIHKVIGIERPDGGRLSL